ncbi:TrkA C-terminal domain-containing protein [Oceanirhabdus sp. W0125-5]|uniref:TrkA C-terminal domain-containing protein n=1 Tax=Oceanirhabdus sp. W0125-5 TaxID=2999116 RepID=UPI0022F30449|nr:TrkA C-terminal domain-containing protein [Oceanirhabdus sp. W0125-5]WBW95684.1 TrkA C-terminal domain-containing protein [Oceanirhabdus sp. W0125-5]
MGQRIEMPRYIKIAVDVAVRIHKGNLPQGVKLRGRSILASEYNVSPETIRKSMKLLDDTGVVEVCKGSGVIVKSKEKALDFINGFKDKETIGMIRSNIKSLLQQRREVERQLYELNEKIIDYSYRFKNADLIDPVEIEIPGSSHIIDMSIGQSKFWHNTGATILGVKRDDKVYISTGPYWDFKEKDVLLVVGDEGVLDRVKNFLENND